MNHYEVVDRETQAVLSLGNREIKIELDGIGNLIWDKDGNFEHIFSGNDQSYIYEDPELSGIRIVAANSGGIRITSSLKQLMYLYLLESMQYI